MPAVRSAHARTFATSTRSPATSQRSAPPHSMSWSPPKSVYGAVERTDSRHSDRPSFAAVAKNACVWSRTLVHSASASVTRSPPSCADCRLHGGLRTGERTRKRPS